MESDRSESRKASEGSQTLSDPIAVRSINASRRANNMPRSISVAPRAEYECFCSAQPCLTPVPELSAVTSLAHFFLGFLKVSYTLGAAKFPFLHNSWISISRHHLDALHSQQASDQLTAFSMDTLSFHLTRLWFWTREREIIMALVS